MKEVELVSTGVYLPGQPVPFDEIEQVIGYFEKAPDQTKRLINKMRAVAKSIIGIEQCHYAIDRASGEIYETNASMAVKAIKQAAQRAKMDIAEIEAIILAGALPDQTMPPTSALIQEQLGIENCFEMEIHSNCTGITKALQVAHDMLRLGRSSNAVVVYSQLSSVYFLAKNYNQNILKRENILLRWFLSDCASAAIFKARDKVEQGIKVVDVYNESVGGKIPQSMWIKLGAMNFNLPEAFDQGLHHYGQDYVAVNDLAPEMAIKGFIKMMEKFGIGLQEIDHLLIPIPSTRLFRKCQEIGEQQYKFPIGKWFNNIPKRGYGGGASMVSGLDEMLQSKKFSAGQKLASFTIESSKWMVGGVVLDYLK